MQKGWEFVLLLRFLCLFAANPFTANGLELKHQGRNVHSPLARPATASVEGGLDRTLRTAPSVSRTSPKSVGLARA
jgi:hypothetical protein